METTEFTHEQKSYIEGFVAGSGLAEKIAQLPTFAATLGLNATASTRPQRPEDIHVTAQDRFLADGKTLSNEEKAKRQQHGLDVWDKVIAHAREGQFPKGTDVFLFKFQGLFYVAPAQDSFMCRLRFPGGIVTSRQMSGLADLAVRFGGGYCDITTRSNLQIRQIKPTDTVELLMGLADLAIINRGAGADNIRNLTASPTAGIDEHELYDVRPLVRELNHYILNHRELYGLPRKFNICIDGGGAISTLGDTNDVCLAAVSVPAGHGIDPGVYFRLLLGGITGHNDFARDCGVLIRPRDVVPVAIAAVRVFIDHADRTDRRKARLKYVLDRLGLDDYVHEMEKHLPAELTRFDIADCQRPRPSIKHAHVGVHVQKQPGLRYVGIVLPAGRLRDDQMRALAEIADEFGSGELRLTVWQNLILPNIPADDLARVELRLREVGLTSSASSVRAGLIACTGNAGCKYAASNTKSHALAIADYLDRVLQLDQPINIHLTGCPHSCAQHHIGDIGLLGTQIAVSEDQTVEGYHVFIGGGAAEQQGIARQLYRDIKADDLPALIESMLRAYLRSRNSAEEGFTEFVRRHTLEELTSLIVAPASTVSVA